MTAAQGSNPGPLSVTLPGTWLLESRIDVNAAGERRPDPLLGENPVALLIYDRSGHFAAQFMKRNRAGSAQEGETAPAQAQNNTRARGGYDAYFGTYTVDDAESTVTQVLQAALSPENVGSTLTRRMHVQGDRLTIELQTNAADGERVTRTLTWRRAG